MDWKISAGLIARHVLTTLGGSLVAKGWIEASDVEPAAGAVLVLSAIAWSIVQKLKAAK